MDKKEMKRDVAVFANMLKELMNSPLEDPLTTLDRDLQHFIYGRVAVLVKHNENKAVGSLADVGTVAGAAIADVIKEFTRNRVESDKMSEAFATVRENILVGFDARTPVITQTASVEETSEATE
jgi:hypothetical protein